MTSSPVETTQRTEPLPEAAVRARQAAWWLFLIAAGTTFVAVQLWLGYDRGSSIGLALPQALAGASRAVSSHVDPQLGSAASVLSLVLALGAAAVLVVLGVFARKPRSWPFAAGMAIYGLDAIVTVLFQAWLAAGIHAVVLWALWNGWRNARQASHVQGAVLEATGPA